MNFKDFLAAMQAIEGDRNISKEIVLAALQEALAKAYRKHIEIPDALVAVNIDEKTGEVSLYQQYLVVEEVEDEELEISLADAKAKMQELELGSLYNVKVNIDELGRAAALLAKNVMKQKIREAEKQAVYDEYIDKLDEMVIGMIESVEEKFVVVNLGKTLAMMPKAAQMPNETYKEGQKVRLVITEVSKDTKGAQVLVSRADAKLVKRLFEKEVPEIFQGIVEIKAIAREAGERTKMAVASKRDDVDPIGACIGPRGQRVQVVIEELRGEKIDIFEWSENITELIKNSLSPAQILAVLPSGEKRGLLVIVDDSQLSLAIGKKGKNARLAVRLTGLRIDIKSKTEVEEQGMNWKKLAQDYAMELEAKQLEKKAQKLAEEKAKLAALEPAVQPVVEVPVEKPIEKEPVVETPVSQPKVETEKPTYVIDVPVQEPVVEKSRPAYKPTPKPVEPVVKAQPKEKAPKKELKERAGYVSRLETVIDAPKTLEKKDEKPIRKKPKSEAEERRLRASDIRKDKDYDIKPEYTPEELEEIAKQQELEAKNTWYEEEIDFDEFEDYYEEE
ncbi:MAG: transcription elongation factor NusA [Firmicutes bacterium GWF2_51_9]|nr:MAG: transcription elongation factor NusA [Firmicutes bacterium GWF2_51_9]OGS59060.1 MAG: transcription elongation factor NusA [Firmicutes bacterium GWE2_51_13]HAM64135.1 transcription termination/antitermination protein NusA [Erysipelotrichaceae bacterium]HAO60795.1 transcription termination/antitermination protein NusA [Erysipelotrichaceae bacterium]HBZ40705.1 transcription termination/antitermination protein NusA [Erysipelotrichaceae bacterium]